MTKNNEDFRILIVDDNRELRAILEEYLSDLGSHIEGADNGKEAIRKFEIAPFDVIITDLNMPEMAGMELIRVLRKDSDMTEFIIITGYASLDSAVEAVKVGAFDYIVKPFRMEELKVVVKNAKDKVMLKKMNIELLKKLKGFYEEVDKFKKGVKAETTDVESLEELEALEKNSEKVLKEIKGLESLKKGRLLID
jgi:DNA-binding NtrC family response regulator